MKILSPFVYIYHGILTIIKAIFTFIKYVFLGILAFPTMIAQIFTSKSTNKVTIENKIANNNYKKTDILLAKHEKEKTKREFKEEKTRNKNQTLTEKNIQKRLNDYIADSTKLEEKVNEEKNDEKKSSFIKPISGWMPSFL